MHFIVTWEIFILGEKWDELNDTLLGFLNGYNIVKLLKTTYVVRIDTTEDYAKLHHQWSDVAEANPGNIEFVMSPLMKAGQYAGYFRQEKWEKLTSELGTGHEHHHGHDHDHQH